MKKKPYLARAPTLEADTDAGVKNATGKLDNILHTTAGKTLKPGKVASSEKVVKNLL